MSGRSYNSHMRPQDRDGSNHGAVGRGRPHQAYSHEHSRSSDFHYMRSRYRYDERDMNNSERRSDPYHAFRSSDRPYASSHRRSYVPSLSQYASSSHSHSYQRNSSYSHEGSRSPDRHHHSLQTNDNNNGYDQSRRPRSFGGRQPKDASYEHHPLASTNGAEMHRARSLMMRSNDFQRYNNAENYANISCDGRMSNMNSYHSHYHQPQPRYDHPKSTSQTYCVGHMSNMNSYHSHYHQPQSRYDHPKSTSQTYCVGHMSNMTSYHSHYHQPQSRYDHPKSTSQTYHERRPLASRQDFSSYPRSSQQISWPTAPLFDNNHTIPELIQIAHANLAAMKPSLTAAFWNKVLKQMSGRNAQNNPRLPNHHEELSRHLHQIYEHTQNTLMLFSTKDLSQVIYSMAKLVDVLRKRNGKRCVEDTDVSLSGLLLNHDMTLNEDLFRSFASASRDKLHHFDARGLSNLAYAYASIGYVPEFDDESDLFDDIATQSAERSAEFNAQGISNMVWAFATVDKPHALLFEAMGNQVVAFKHLGEFKPQNLVNTVWAYAKAGIHRLMLFEKMANHIGGLDSLDRFKPQELTNTVWAYATAQVPNPKLFQKVTFAAIQRREEFNSQDVANLLLAYATMGIIDKQLFLSFVPTAAKLIVSYNNQDFANIALAYAVADVDALILFNDHFIHKCVEKNGGFEIKELTQLHQWHLWQTKEKSHAGLPLELQKKCYEAFTSEDPRASKLQDDVVSQLSSISLELQEEVLMDSGYRIDAIVEVNGKQVGIEVDGPYHFIGQSKSPLARTILKRRQVPSIDGIELLSVPYWEWNKLGKDEVKKQEYLRELLKL